MKNPIDIVKAVVLPIVVIALWFIAGEAQYINISIIPTPLQVATTFRDMFLDSTLFRHILASLIRVGKGFLIGGSAGVALGILIGSSPTLDKYTVALVGILRPIPAIAFVPLLIVAFGIGEESKVAVIVIGSFWPVLLNTIHGIQAVDTKLLEVGTIFRKSRLTVLRKIVLPSALPVMYTGFRLGIGAAWTCVVTAEMIAAKSGVGYLIMYAREISKPRIMFVGIISIGLFGLLIDIVLLKIQKKIFAWAE